MTFESQKIQKGNNSIENQYQYFHVVLLKGLYHGSRGAVVSALNFRYEGRWFEAQSPPPGCFLRQETVTLPHIVSLHPSVDMGTGDIL